MNYLFKNGRYMNEEGKIVATDLLVQDGKIAKVAENITADNAEVIDVNGKLIAPGLVDVQYTFVNQVVNIKKQLKQVH